MMWYAGAAVLAAVLCGIYWRWARRVEAELAEGAAIEWARIGDRDPALIKGLDRAKFGAIYRRVHFPRFPGYALATIASFLLTLPIAFGLLSGGLWAAEKLGWTPEPAEIANRFLVEGDSMKIVSAAPSEAALYYVEDLGGFYYFFGILFIWALIVAFFMRRFHARRPGYLRDEILRAR